MSALWQELTARDSDGINVSFQWRNYCNEDEFRVHVLDNRDGTDFILNPQNFNEARECFHHPFAVANSVLKTGRIAA